MANPTTYKKYALILDESIKEDKELIKWIEKNRAKRNSYAMILRKALAEYIKLVEGKSE